MSSNARFRVLFEEAPSGMAILTIDGRWTQVNRALCELLGYAEHELTGDSADTFVHPADLTGGEQRARLLSGEVESVQLERRFIRRDGVVLWVKVSCSLVRDERGEPEHFVALYQDITEGKSVEQALARERRWLAESQEAGRIGSWEIDLETGVMRWSEEQFKLYGVEPTGETPQLDELLDLIHPEDRHAMLTSLRTHMASGEDFVDEYRILHPVLGVRTVLVRGRYLPRDAGARRPARMAGTTHDVTTERAAEAERRRGEERVRLLATIVQQSEDAIMVCSREGLITDWNEGARRLYGWTEEEALGRTVGFLVPAELRGEGEDLIRRALRGEVVRSMHTIRERRDGTNVQVSLTVSPIIGVDGLVVGASASARDITAQLRAQERLLNNERQMDDAQALAHVGSWEWELARPRPTWSAELARIYGFDPAYSPRADDLTARIHPDDRPRVREMIERARGGESCEGEYRVMVPHGELRFVFARHHTRLGIRGEVTHIYGAVQDITERKHYEAELERLATHDPLTGLPNRRTFDERLTVELARARREGTPLSLALLDIDNFKRINDTLGHPVGDGVLIRAGEVFGRQVRAHELIARVGGEEFAWILPSADAEGAAIAVERVRAALAATHFGEAGHVTLSAGICTLTEGLDAGAFYRCADMALLAAKKGGRNRIVSSRSPGVGVGEASRNVA